MPPPSERSSKEALVLKFIRRIGIPSQFALEKYIFGEDATKGSLFDMMGEMEKILRAGNHIRRDILGMLEGSVTRWNDSSVNFFQGLVAKDPFANCTSGCITLPPNVSRPTLKQVTMMAAIMRMIMCKDYGRRPKGATSGVAPECVILYDGDRSFSFMVDASVGFVANFSVNAAIKFAACGIFGSRSDRVDWHKMAVLQYTTPTGTPIKLGTWANFLEGLGMLAHDANGGRLLAFARDVQPVGELTARSIGLTREIVAVVRACRVAMRGATHASMSWEVPVTNRRVEDLEARPLVDKAASVSTEASDDDDDDDSVIGSISDSDDSSDDESDDGLDLPVETVEVPPKCPTGGAPQERVPATKEGGMELDDEPQVMLGDDMEVEEEDFVAPASMMVKMCDSLGETACGPID